MTNITNERKLQHALCFIALHTGEKNTARDKDLRLALKLIGECLSPDELAEARTTFTAMKAKAATPKPDAVAQAKQDMQARLTITRNPAQSTPTPMPNPRLAAATGAPNPSPLASAISAFPPVFGFKHFANSIRFRIMPSESTVTPDGKVMLAVHRLAKGSATESAFFGKVSPDGLRSQIAA